MVSKARDDFPLPDTPVITTNLFLGISISIFFKLFSLAPFTTILSIISLPFTSFVLYHNIKFLLEKELKFQFFYSLLSSNIISLSSVALSKSSFLADYIIYFSKFLIISSFSFLLYAFVLPFSLSLSSLLIRSLISF